MQVGFGVFQRYAQVQGVRLQHKAFFWYFESNNLIVKFSIEPTGVGSCALIRVILAHQFR